MIRAATTVAMGLALAAIGTAATAQADETEDAFLRDVTAQGIYTVNPESFEGRTASEATANSGWLACNLLFDGDVTEVGSELRMAGELNKGETQFVLAAIKHLCPEMAEQGAYCSAFGLVAAEKWRGTTGREWFVTNLEYLDAIANSLRLKILIPGE